MVCKRNQNTHRRDSFRSLRQGLELVILGRDERGAFRWIEGDSSFEAEAVAKQKLTAAMHRIDQSGETVFPQGD
jgi:3',5'-cyclic AMP phosphodiesterase CpdA